MPQSDTVPVLGIGLKIIKKITFSGMVRIFIWAARLPTVAVGLSAVLRFARAAPIPAATGPRCGVGIFHTVTGLRDGQTLLRQISWQS